MQPKSSRYEVKDGGSALYIVVQPSGVKSFQYRGRLDGKSFRKTIGKIGEITLKRVREAALEIQHGVRSGEVPKRRGAKTCVPECVPETNLLTVAEFWNLYMEREGETRANATEKWRMWLNDIAPSIGSKSILAVTRLDCASIVQRKYDAIRANGGNGTGSNRLHGHLSRFFNWASGEGWADTQLELSPMSKVKKLLNESENIRQRRFDKQEIIWFFKALPLMKTERYNDESETHARAFELILRSVARRSEVCHVGESTGFTYDSRFDEFTDITTTSASKEFSINSRVQSEKFIRMNFVCEYNSKSPSVRTAKPSLRVLI